LVKKVLVGGLFIIGGYFLIKKLLPSSNLSTNTDPNFNFEEYKVKESVLPSNYQNPYKRKDKIISQRGKDDVTRYSGDARMNNYGDMIGTFDSSWSESPLSMMYSNRRNQVGV
jgi:hypothetical protein|tara:strand:+ start:710 stop:1048 length:339 start_codon:yes stop_codon:yes gene_type:complete